MLKPLLKVSDGMKLLVLLRTNSTGTAVRPSRLMYEVLRKLHLVCCCVTVFTAAMTGPVRNPGRRNTDCV